MNDGTNDLENFVPYTGDDVGALLFACDDLMERMAKHLGEKGELPQENPANIKMLTKLGRALGYLSSKLDLHLDRLAADAASGSNVMAVSRQFQKIPVNKGRLYDLLAIMAQGKLLANGFEVFTFDLTEEALIVRVPASIEEGESLAWQALDMAWSELRDIAREFIHRGVKSAPDFDTFRMRDVTELAIRMEIVPD